jgi:hypothetical protein
MMAEQDAVDGSKVDWGFSDDVTFEAQLKGFSLLPEDHRMVLAFRAAAVRLINAEKEYAESSQGDKRMKAKRDLGTAADALSRRLQSVGAGHRIVEAIKEPALSSGDNAACAPAALQALDRAVRELQLPEPPTPQRGRRQTSEQSVTAALAVKAQHPEWSDVKIARKVGCAPCTLSASELWRAGRNTVRRGGTVRRGSKDKDGDIEAVAE